MIPPDVASNLRLNLPEQQAVARQSQPVLPTQQITDALSNLVPGQRLLAEIQAILPNGTYRAIVAQREITLALPFSAKPGDSLELEVQENDGHLTLAFIANRSAQVASQGAAESVSTTLSRTGQLIGNLLEGIDDPSGRTKATPLNGNQPLVQQMPANAAELMPVLKQAISQSGVFYEAHQAKWVAGELPTEALHEEPQGKLSITLPVTNQNSELAPDKVAQKSALASEASRLASVTTTANDQTQNTGQTIPRELVPLVQQQLDALATQNYAWQGQVWPGQQMWWEIGEQPTDGRSGGDDAAPQWQTRLKLDLPNLGGVDLTLRLQAGGRIDIVAKATSRDGEAALRDGAPSLKESLAASGLNLSQFLVRHEQPGP